MPEAERAIQKLALNETVTLNNSYWSYYLSNVKEIELGLLFCINFLHKVQVLIHSYFILPSMAKWHLCHFAPKYPVFECRNWYTSPLHSGDFSKVG